MAETYYIKVQNDTSYGPTQVSIVERPMGTNNVVTKDLKRNTMEGATIEKSLGTLAKASAVGSAVVIDYFELSGETAKANTLKNGVQYAMGAIGGFKVGGPAGAVVAVALIQTKKQLDYKRERILDNAKTEYLREQTKTRKNNSKGDYYRWKI